MFKNVCWTWHSIRYKYYRHEDFCSLEHGHQLETRSELVSEWQGPLTGITFSLGYLHTQRGFCFPYESPRVMRITRITCTTIPCTSGTPYDSGKRCLEMDDSRIPLGGAVLPWYFSGFLDCVWVMLGIHLEDYTLKWRERDFVTFTAKLHPSPSFSFQKVDPAKDGNYTVLCEFDIN